MTNRLFLSDSVLYANAHKISLVVLLLGSYLNMNFLAAAWPLFCAFGFSIYLKNESKTLFSAVGLASCIPFVFSLISSVWFVAGVNDLHLLGYDRAWSFYAAIHGSFLGWLFVGCLAHLSRRASASRVYLWSCFLSLVFFLFIAFGINGVPFIKPIGVVGFSVLVPFAIGHYAFEKTQKPRASRVLALVSLAAIASSMTLAVLNEFWPGVPRVVLGFPMMVLVHGSLNAIIAVPCFFFAIWFERDATN